MSGFFFKKGAVISATNSNLATALPDVSIVDAAQPSTPGILGRRVARLTCTQGTMGANDFCFIKFTDNASETIAATGTTVGVPLVPGSIEVFEVPPHLTHILCITSAGASTLHLSMGYEK